MCEHVIGGSADIFMVMAMRMITAVMVVVVVVRHIYGYENLSYPSSINKYNAEGHVVMYQPIFAAPQNFWGNVDVYSIMTRTCQSLSLICFLYFCDKALRVHLRPSKRSNCVCDVAHR